MTSKKSEPLSHNDVLKNLEPFSKALGKAAGQVWKIFVMRYVAKGLSELFLAVFINWVAYIFLWEPHKLMMLIPLAAGGVLVFDAIQLLINPYYFAMNDVAIRLKSENIFKH